MCVCWENQSGCIVSEAEEARRQQQQQQRHPTFTIAASKSTGTTGRLSGEKYVGERGRLGNFESTHTDTWSEV